MNEFKDLRNKVDDFIMLLFVKFQLAKEEMLDKLEKTYADLQKNK